jgi:putative copper export protein/mono/diheme cytochrome c family protein
MIDLLTIMALVRGLHLAATLSLLGSAGFIAWILPAAGTPPAALRRRLNALVRISGLIAVVAGTVWFAWQAAAIAGAEDLSDLWDALPVVAMHTRYGTILLVRLALLAVATVLAWPGHRPLLVMAGGGPPATPCSAGPDKGLDSGPPPAMTWPYLIVLVTATALGLQGLIGHAGAMEGAAGDELVASEALHLIAAGIWFGALLPLVLSLFALPPPLAALVCERFTPIGLACVLVLAGTGLAQGLDLIGSVPALLGTRYGQIALVKIGFFLSALMLAALNRLRLTDRLAVGAASARRHLLLSVGVETLVGLAIVNAAAFMASSPPAAHTAPVWPFSWRVSLVTVNEDADFRAEVIASLMLIGGAVVLLPGALLWRRLRLPALAVLVAAVVWRGPSLMLLTVEAVPTSFQTSPTGFSAAAIVRGQALYDSNCAACHGADGAGGGTAAAALRIKPADLTLPHLWEHSDGEMFWWLSHGMDDPEGGLAMPGFAESLSADDRWALIDYVRAHNAGLAMQQPEAPDIPVRAPGFAMTCTDMPASGLADLRGRVVLVSAAETDSQPPIPPQDGIPTIRVTLRNDPARPPGTCAAADPAAAGAYAVLANVAPDDLAGTEFLVDTNGWLRAVRRPGTAGGWHTRDELIAAIRSICANPIQPPRGGGHEHHH